MTEIKRKLIQIANSKTLVKLVITGDEDYYVGILHWHEECGDIFTMFEAGTPTKEINLEDVESISTMTEIWNKKEAALSKLP